MKKLLKIKAFVMILLIISITFYTSISLGALSANPVVVEEKENNFKFNYFDFIKHDIFQEVNAEDKVCCQKTKQSSEFQGASCVYTEANNCDLSSGTPSVTSCEQTDYCRPSCCINLANGQCQDNVEATVCSDLGGASRAGACEDVGQCKVGCCNLPSGSRLITQAQCSSAINVYPNLVLNDVFDSSIQDEQLCIQQSLGTEEGCCVLPDQCSFGTRGDCSAQSGDFKLNMLCSYAPLGCPVTEKHHTQCYQGKVYWYDSSNNRENVYGTNYRQDGQLILPKDSCPLDNQGLSNNLQCGNCEYALGTTCQDATSGFTSQLPQNLRDKVTNQCVSLACVNTEQSKKDSAGRDVNPWMDGERKENGESWCEYTSKTGEGNDLVGSRQYLHRCVDGVEVTEPCDERRNTICVQNEVPGELIDPSNPTQRDRTYADCVPNEWQQCLAANAANEQCDVSQQEAFITYLDLYRYNGQDRSFLGTGSTKYPVGPCDVFLLSADDGSLQIYLEDQQQNFESCVLKNACRKKTCEEEVIGNCYFNKEVGLCAPSVPPGTLGKEAEFAVLSEGEKLGFSFECKEIWFNPNVGGEECEANCLCKRSVYADRWNNFCNNLGDLGAKYNLVGKYSSTSFIHKRLSSGDSADVAGPADGLSPPRSFSSYTSNLEPLTGDFWSLLTSLENLRAIHKDDLNDPDFVTGFRQSWVPWILSFGTVAASLAIINTFSFVGVFDFVPAVGVFGAEGGILGIAPLTSVLGIGIVIAAIVILYFFFNWLLGGEQEEVNYLLQCNPYSPPAKGLNCDLCNDRSKFRECNEYLCTSLGKACEFIDTSSTSEESNGVCVWRNRGDTRPVVIEPLPISPRTLSDFIITPPTTGRQGGYEFRETLRSFESVEVGVRTLSLDTTTNRLVNASAECKISRKINFDYETEGQLITNGLSAQHTILLPISQSGITEGEDVIELETGKENVFYIKCESINEVVNTNSYFIKIRLEIGPDLSPPLIKGFNLEDNSYLRYNLNRTNIILYYEDQTGVANSRTGFIGGCKYSKVNQDYNLMENNMSCLQSRLTSGQHQGEFSCAANARLSPNQDNTFYFRCKDVSERQNVNTQSKSLTLKASNALLITSKSPEGDLLTTDTNITLTTSQGAESGKSTCYYAGGIKEFVTRDLTFSASGIKFTSTNSDNHETKLSLQNEQDYLYYVWCRDIAGNEAKDVVEFHTTTPDLIIEDASPNDETFYTDKIRLRVITSGGIHGDGDSTCSYNGDINGYFNEGKTTSQDRTIHVKNVTLISSGITYNVSITCSDQYKSVTKPIEFTVNYAAFPQIIRLFRQQNVLNILLNNPAECRYSLTNANFDFNQTATKMISANNNLQHSMQISSSVIYIKCKDTRTNNIGPASGSYKVYP